MESKINLTEDEKTKFENNRQALVTRRQRKMEGVLLRSRAKWIAEGEGLERRNYVSKQMIKLILTNGEEISETKDIIKE